MMTPGCLCNPPRSVYLPYAVEYRTADHHTDALIAAELPPTYSDFRIPCCKPQHVLLKSQDRLMFSQNLKQKISTSKQQAVASSAAGVER
jgi:hypothetical protein